MPPLHIGTITFDWYPFHPRVRRLAEAALDAGYVVDVICLRQPGEESYEVYNGVHIYRVPLNRSFDTPLPKTVLLWFWFILLAGITITRLHLKHPYHAIHVHNLPDILVFAALVPKLMGTKIILDVQDTSPELMAEKVTGPLSKIVILLASWQERLSAAFADHVVTVGWPFEKLLLKRGIAQQKLTCIINSADPKIFPQECRPDAPTESSGESKPFILLYHGTVAKRQGLDIAIRALALARDVVPSIRLHLKGFGDQLSSIKKLVEDLGVSEQVEFSDFCPIGEVADFIARGDVGIIPYRSGGFMELILPTKAYEFAWMRRPMIASNLYGIRSMFRPESVCYCDPSEPESFAQAIIDLYQHPEKRASLIANAAEDYLPYRWELEAERYQHLLAKLCHKPVSEQNPGLSR